MSTAAVTIVTDETLGIVSPLLHGQFAEHLGRCVNDGLWVGHGSRIPNSDGLRLDVLTALFGLGVPLLRWPGGCYADTYHWRDGIGPRSERPRTLGESCGLHALEDNGMGTHEFIALCRAIGAEPYLVGNLGSGSPQEMMDWVHYCNGKRDTTLVRERTANEHAEPMNVRYWGVGNESGGCGGNYDASDYAKEFRRFSTFLKRVDNSIELVACGDNNQDWNLRVVETLRNDLDYLDHLSVHRYCQAGHAIRFTEDEYYQILRAGEVVESDICRTDEILRFFTAGRTSPAERASAQDGPAPAEHRQVGIAFDAWGVWHPEARGNCDYEAPSTLRDALAAAGVLDIFQRWCARVSLANLAQIVNVLQCLIQTEADRVWLTPTYHVFRLYAPHRGAEAVRAVITDAPTMDAPALAEAAAGPLALLSVSASRKNEALVLSLTNRHLTEAMEVTVSARDGSLGAGTLATLTADAPSAVNSAEEPDRVTVTQSAVSGEGERLTLILPPCSVQTLVFTE